jgi:alpha-tubulin suppressor-like RCC1 family protein
MRRIVKITSGYFHTCVQTDDGILQILGRGADKLQNVKIHSIAAGSEYTVFTTDNNEVYAHGPILTSLCSEANYNDSNWVKIENQVLQTFQNNYNYKIQVASGRDHIIFYLKEYDNISRGFPRLKPILPLHDVTIYHV